MRNDEQLLIEPLHDYFNRLIKLNDEEKRLVAEKFHIVHSLKKIF